jgi:hypothetical protein
LQDYIKRVRKQCGSKLRYVAVLEKTKAGNPHYHMLVHEIDQNNTVTKAVLREQWASRHGFVDAVLVKDRSGTVAGRMTGGTAAVAAARYVAKYLAKSSLSRVRASKDYGRATLEPEVRRERSLLVKLASLGLPELALLDRRSESYGGNDIERTKQKMTNYAGRFSDLQVSAFLKEL